MENKKRKADTTELMLAVLDTMENLRKFMAAADKYAWSEKAGEKLESLNKMRESFDRIELDFGRTDSEYKAFIENAIN